MRAEDPHPGFPCITVNQYLYKAVKQGEQGEENAAHIFENLLYTFPGNIPESVLLALVEEIVSFTTFSRLNVDRMLKSFSCHKVTL